MIEIADSGAPQNPHALASSRFGLRTCHSHPQTAHLATRLVTLGAVAAGPCIVVE
jgi:hypothetical protein